MAKIRKVDAFGNWEAVEESLAPAKLQMARAVYRGGETDFLIQRWEVTFGGSYREYVAGKKAERANAHTT